jgi:aspartate racemase
MPEHIGIIACSAEGAALCYRTICLEGQDLMGREDHPEVSMHTHSLGRYMRFIRSGDWEGVAGLMISSAEKLTAAGADFFICPDNTIHQAFDLAVSQTARPWLHIAEEVAAEARRRGYRRLGILGTRYLMEGPVYERKLAELYLEQTVPDGNQRQRIDEIIFSELVQGRFTNASRSYFQQVIGELKDRGCDAVVLGCTEIPLLVTQESSPLPILDSTRLLARAALRRAV